MENWWCAIVCCLIDDHGKHNDQMFVHSRYRKDFQRSLDSFHRRLRQRKIPRCCLQDQSVSAWQRLYESQNDQGLITLTGFDCSTFDSLCALFAPVFDSYTPFVASGSSCFERKKHVNKGRPRKIRPEDCLGLVLAWTRTRGSLMVLQLIFGMTYTNLDDYLLFAKRIIVKVLRKHPMAMVKIPTSKKIEEYKEMIRNRHQNLHNVWCTMDGVKLLLEQSGDALIQEQYYNGWTHDHYVTSVLCFCPDGTIPIAFVNVPGTVHDSQIAEY